jgi:hypothetical protein
MARDVTVTVRDKDQQTIERFERGKVSEGLTPESAVTLTTGIGEGTS